MQRSMSALQLQQNQQQQLLLQLAGMNPQALAQVAFVLQKSLRQQTSKHTQGDRVCISFLEIATFSSSRIKRVGKRKES